MTSPIMNEEEEIDGSKQVDQADDVQTRKSYAEAVSPSKKRKAVSPTGDTPTEILFVVWQTTTKP